MQAASLVLVTAPPWLQRPQIVGCAHGILATYQGFTLGVGALRMFVMGRARGIVEDRRQCQHVYETDSRATHSAFQGWEGLSNFRSTILIGERFCGRKRKSKEKSHHIQLRGSPRSRLTPSLS